MYPHMAAVQHGGHVKALATATNCCSQVGQLLQCKVQKNRRLTALDSGKVAMRKHKVDIPA